MSESVVDFSMPVKRVLAGKDRKPIFVPSDVHQEFSEFHSEYGRAQAWVTGEMVILAGIEALKRKLKSAA